MAHNSNFYNNFPQFTFQCPPPFPPPHTQRPFFMSPVTSAVIPDEEFIKRFDKPAQVFLPKQNPISISTAKEKLQNLILCLNDLKNQQKELEEKFRTIPDSEWSNALHEIEKNKLEINNTMAEITSNLDVLTKLLAKRSAKRLRLNRVRCEWQKEKEDWRKEMEERSRKIDENLQKIKDDIKKAKQEEDNKQQADTILKEVLRKKHDAKKYLVKLEALMKLRRARANTARGRGEAVAEKDSEVFNSNIEKLKQFWTEKLSLYDKEETDLRATLQKDVDSNSQTEKMQHVVENLEQWMEFLFGGDTPQVDFGGDVEGFIRVRSEWDKYISTDGTSLPIGWVVPKTVQ